MGSMSSRSLHSQDESTQLEDLASTIDARYAHERREFQREREQENRSGSTTDAVLYTFKVPVSRLLATLPPELTCLWPQTFRQAIFERRLRQLRDTSVLEEVFSVRHLPGFIFVTASPLKISEAYRRASSLDTCLPFPIPTMPRGEWLGNLDSVPWLRRYVPPGSWVVVADYTDKSEQGKLGYVLGSCHVTQRSLVAVIPNLPPLDVMPDKDGDEKTQHERGKAAREAAFREEITFAKSRFLASEEEARIAAAILRIESQRSEIKRSVGTPEERRKALADLKKVEDEETAWGITESRIVRSRKRHPRLWKLEEYYRTRKVFGVRHSAGTSFSKAFSTKFALPKISRQADNPANLEVKVDTLEVEKFNWAFINTNEYIVYEYLGRFYLNGLRIIPIFSPESLQLISTPPLGDELRFFVDSFLHQASIHRLFSKLHWKRGDRIRYQNETYLLGELNIDEGSVTGRKLNTKFSDETYELSQADVAMPVHEVDRIVRVGDGVEVIAGHYQGQTGTVLEENGEYLTVWTTISEEGVPVSCFDSELCFDLTLLAYKVSISISRHLVASCLVTSGLKKVKVGNDVRVVSGPLVNTTGKVTRIAGGLVFILCGGIEVCCIRFIV